MSTKTFVAPFNDWVNLGPGPLLISSKTVGTVYLAQGAAKPGLTEFGHAIGSALAVKNFEFFTPEDIWARGATEAETLVVSEIQGPSGTGTGSGASRLRDLLDVSAKPPRAPNNHDLLEFNTALNQWAPVKPLPDVTVKPMASDADPDATKLSAGYLVVTTEQNKHRISVVSATGTLVPLFDDNELNQRIAANSLFQGAVTNVAELSALPTPVDKNRGFYWTWQGASNFVIAGAGVTGPIVDPAKGLATETLNPGDWLQSDGVKWLHVSSDLLSKARWNTLGGFVLFVAGSYEPGSLVIHRPVAGGSLHYYRATGAVAITDPAPGLPGAKWEDISPESAIRTSSDYDNTNPPTDGQAIVWDEATKKFVPKTLSQPIVYYGAGAYDAASVTAPLFGMATGTVPDPNTWIPAAGDLYIDTLTGGITLLTGGATTPASPTGNRANPVTGGTTTTFDIGGEGFIPLFRGNYSVGSNTGGVYTAPVNPAEGDIWVDKNANPPVFKVYRAGAWVQVDPSVNHLGLLSDLANVDVGRTNPPQQGDALVYNKLEEKWISGAVPAHLTEYDKNTDYAAGTTIYYKGGLFEAKTRTTGVSPDFQYGDVWFFHRSNFAGTGDYIGPVSFEAVNVVADATVAPTRTYAPDDLRPHWTLQYTDDNNWAIWQWELSMRGWTPGSALPVAQWHQYDSLFTKPTARRLWRNYSSPTSHVGDVVVWVYDDPKGLNKPHYRDFPWLLRPIRSDLVSMHDVKAENPADQSILIWNTGTSYWEAKPNPSYTKLETDAKIQVVAQGLSHGVSVNAIQNIPPVTPITYEYFIVGIAGAGDWTGHNNEIAWWDGTAWKFTTPSIGDTHLVERAGAGGENWNWNGTAWVKVANATTSPSSAASLFTIGDIKQSLLTETQFIAELGAVEGRKWVLADGRNVAGTRYATITGNLTVPDLRGAYLRMAGQNATNAAWNGGALNAYQEDSTARPKNPFTTDGGGAHSHLLGLAVYGGDANSPLINGYPRGAAGSRRTVGNVGSDFPASMPGTDTATAHTHTISGGDAESRPKTYATNFYIKVD
jgi:Protein of unknown function (DUF2793)